MANSEPPAKRQRIEGIPVPPGISAFNHVEDWFEQNRAEFGPPVCNRLMHKGQLSVMFVGGPNTRKDFHMEEGSEFFFQMRGDIELPTLQGGERKVAKIKQGQVFCLPSRIPHSPQRPMPNSFGLVIERKRLHTEFDGLIYYTDFEKCKRVLWEKFFRCEDLAKDLPPIINEFKQFESSVDSKKKQNYPEDERPSRQDVTTVVPAPFSLQDFLSANKDKLASGEMLPLFGHDHPDKEFEIMVVGGPTEHKRKSETGDTWMYQIHGSAHVAVEGGTLTLEEGCCCIVNPNVSYDVVRPCGSIGLIVQQGTRGNKRENSNPVGSGSGSGEDQDSGSGSGVSGSGEDQDSDSGSGD